MNTYDGFNDFEAHKYNYSYKEFKSLGFTQIIGVGRIMLPIRKLGIMFSSLGLFFPSKSRYLLGYWFADNKKRNLFAE